MNPTLPVGRLRVYQIQHVKDPESWFKTHSRHNKDFHLANLRALSIILDQSCYAGKDSNQNILCQVGEEIHFLGDLVISKTRILSSDNLLYEIDENQIRVVTEDEEDHQVVYYYSNLDGTWKTSHPVKKIPNPFLVETLRMQTIAAKKANEANEFLRDIQERKKQFQNYNLLCEEETVEVGIQRDRNFNP